MISQPAEAKPFGIATDGDSGVAPNAAAENARHATRTMGFMVIPT